MATASVLKGLARIATTTAGVAATASTANRNHRGSPLFRSATTPIDGEDYVDGERGNGGRRCRACLSTSLHVDWAQGDRVCTSCGVVDEEHLLDDRPEWREFTEADDLVRAGGGDAVAARARCGFIPVDETKYIGGLQPTCLSNHVYGGMGTAASRRSSEASRKQLIQTHGRIERMVEKLHSRDLESTKLSIQIRKRNQRKHNSAAAKDDDAVEKDIRPELEQMLVIEEEEANRAQATLFAEKWSLQRAIRLCGSAHEQTTLGESSDHFDERAIQKDASLQKASRELYCAYSILLATSKKLKLSERIQNKAVDLLCRYASRSDSLAVRGVSSTLKRKPNPKKHTSKAMAEKEREAQEALRDYNKMKQIGSLCSAALVLSARNLGVPVTFDEVCKNVQPGQLNTSTGDMRTVSSLLPQLGKGDQFVKRKHGFKALNQLKEAFPGVAALAESSPHGNSNSNAPASLLHADSGPDDDTATANFTDHTIRKLRLPPVAEAAIRTLVLFCYREEQKKTNAAGNNAIAKSSRNLLTLCSSLTYFVCTAGHIMQRLAHQAVKSKKRRSFTGRGSSPERPLTAVKKIRRETKETLRQGEVSKISEGDTMAGDSELSPNNEQKKPKDETPFDVFDNSADADTAAAEHREYEMGRIWDAWAEQMPWLRTFADVEHSCGASRQSMLQHYQTCIHPQRQTLLAVLKGAATASDASESQPSALSCTPMASVLLPNIVAAAPLMKLDGTP